MSENSQPLEKTDVTTVEEVLKFLDKFNYESKIKGDIELKALEVQQQQNKLVFDYNLKNLENEKEAARESNARKNVITWFILVVILILITGSFFFIYIGKANEIKDFAIPVITAIAGALTGYGYGYKKGLDKKED